MYKYTISGKNGYTPKAGKTLVSGADKNDLSLSAVSLNDSDIYNITKEISYLVYEGHFDANSIKDMTRPPV